MAIKTLLIEYDDTHGNGMGGYTLSAPAVEVVRCRDCRHAVMAINGEYAKYCKLLTTLDELGYPKSEPQFDADFYCAWGERRDTC